MSIELTEPCIDASWRCIRNARVAVEFYPLKLIMGAGTESAFLTDHMLTGSYKNPRFVCPIHHSSDYKQTYSIATCLKPILHCQSLSYAPYSTFPCHYITYPSQAGAGPSGLILALILAKYGIAVRIIDKISTFQNTVRGIVLHVSYTLLCGFSSAEADDILCAASFA